MASLSGLDGVVFTAGVGENAAAIRSAISERLAWTGLILDAEANARCAGQISTPDSRLKAWVSGNDRSTHR